MKLKMEKISFDADKETLTALKVVVRTLGRGNKAAGIRRAIIVTAQRLTDKAVAERRAKLDADWSEALTPDAKLAKHIAEHMDKVTP